MLIQQDLHLLDPLALHYRDRSVAEFDDFELLIAPFLFHRHEHILQAVLLLGLIGDIGNDVHRFEVDLQAEQVLQAEQFVVERGFCDFFDVIPVAGLERLVGEDLDGWLPFSQLVYFLAHL
jgi:hypothetical protein